TNDFMGTLDVSGGARSPTGPVLAADGAVGVVEAPTAVLANNDGGQRDNSLSAGNIDDANLLAFKLTAYTQTTRVSSLTVRVSGVTGVLDGDWSDVRIYEDPDGNGRIEAGETTAVGGAGSVDIAAGNITFSTPFTFPTAGMNYVMTADLANLTGGDAFRLNLSTSNIALVSVTNGTETALRFTGGRVSEAMHSVNSIIVWDGGAADGLWHSADNWDPNTVPVEYSQVTIDQDVTVTALASEPGVRFNTLVIGNSGGTTSPTLVLSTGIANAPAALTVHKNATLRQDTTQPLSIQGNLTVNQGGKLTHAANASSRAAILDLRVGNTFTLNSGSTITADAAGYGGGYGPGAGLPSLAAATGGSGAGYGGFGGAGAPGSKPGGAPYGSIYA
ncbi:MAG TPA: hypothetical protein PK523_13185, partial [Elusimicrobiales bacterium]|nr:hypothetical protein [Elusimicrobiales bacterium]